MATQRHYVMTTEPTPVEKLGHCDVTLGTLETIALRTQVGGVRTSWLAGESGTREFSIFGKRRYCLREFPAPVMVPELYVLCDPLKPLVRLSRLPPCPQDTLRFSAPLPDTHPPQLLVFGVGDWSGLSGDGRIEVKLEGCGAREHQLGTLTHESRCFLWDRGTSDDSSWVPEEGELRVSMVIKGQTQCEKLVNSSGLKSTCDAVTSEVTPKV
ncbi:hypothetical protein FKM82_019567 [Ascaphus truei]